MIIFTPTAHSISSFFGGNGAANNLCEFLKTELTTEGWTATRVKGGITFTLALNVVHCSDIIIDGTRYVWYNIDLGP